MEEGGGIRALLNPVRKSHFLLVKRTQSTTSGSRWWHDILLGPKCENVTCYRPLPPCRCLQGCHCCWSIFMNSKSRAVACPALNLSLFSSDKVHHPQASLLSMETLTQAAFHTLSLSLLAFLDPVSIRNLSSSPPPPSF